MFKKHEVGRNLEAIVHIYPNIPCMSNLIGYNSKLTKFLVSTVDNKRLQTLIC